MKFFKKLILIALSLLIVSAQTKAREIESKSETKTKIKFFVTITLKLINPQYDTQFCIAKLSSNLGKDWIFDSKYNPKLVSMPTNIKYNVEAAIYRYEGNRYPIELPSMNDVSFTYDSDLVIDVMNETMQFYTKANDN